MYQKIILTALVVIFMFAGPAYSQNFHVKEVRLDLGEAVILNVDTGTESIVRTGQEIDGWRVTEIMLDHVTIVTTGADGVGVIGKLPVNGGGRLITIIPQP